MRAEDKNPDHIKPGDLIDLADGTQGLAGIDGEVLPVHGETTSWQEDDQVEIAKERYIPRGEEWKIRCLPTLAKDFVMGRLVRHNWFGKAGKVGDDWFPRFRIPCILSSSPQRLSAHSPGQCPLCEAARTFSQSGEEHLAKTIAVHVEWSIPVILIERRQFTGGQWEPFSTEHMARPVYLSINLSLHNKIFSLAAECAKGKHVGHGLNEIGDLRHGCTLVISRALDGVTTLQAEPAAPLAGEDDIERIERRLRIGLPAPRTVVPWPTRDVEQIASTITSPDFVEPSPEERRPEYVLEELFRGKQVSLVPQAWTTKRPVRFEYMEKAPQWTRQPNDYFPILDHCNIAVLTGPQSDNVVSIDLDDDQFVDPFLDANPWARHAQFSRGGRGGNIWCQIKGKYPAQKIDIQLKDGSPVGEFRGGDCLTTVSGLHKSGRLYTVKHAGHVPCISFEDIRLPSGWSFHEARAKSATSEFTDSPVKCLLDVSKLKVVRKGANGSVIAQCPACAEHGSDKSGNHLTIFGNGRYYCVVNGSDPEHMRRVLALAGVDDDFQLPSRSSVGRKAASDPKEKAATPKAARVHPQRWFAERYPTLVKQFGDAIRVDTSETRDGKQVLRFAELNEDFFANLLGEIGSPESPTVYAVDESRFFTYDKSTGVFTAVLPEALMGTITGLLRECAIYYEGTSSVDTTGLIYRLGKKRTLDGVVAKAKACLAVQAQHFFAGANRDTVACANGLLDLQTRELQPFSPAHRLRSKLPLKFDPGATCQRFENFIATLFPAKDDEEVIQQFLGQCLTGRNWCQRLVVLNGEGGVGKGTISNVITGILGPQHVGSLRVGQLSERFELGRLRGKWLAFDGDAPRDLLSSKSSYILKGITGDDYMSFELKGSNEQPSQRMAINILCCTNHRLLIKLAGDETAWARRLIYIPITAPTPENPIPCYADCLLEEASGILNWLLVGLDKLKNRNWRIQLSERQEHIVERLLTESSSVSSFIRECIIREEDSDLTTDEAYTVYTAYCGSREYQPVSKRHFEQRSGEEMLDTHGITKAHSLDRGGARRGWNGVSVTNEWQKYLPKVIDPDD